MNILITICARGGSKGVKNKNIRKINGKPLITYTLEVAKQWGKATRIVCSTDSTKIAEVAKQYGADIPFMRPDSLATDTSGKLPAIRHAFTESEKIYSEKYDVIVDLDVTSPLRTVQDLDNCLKEYTSKKPELLFSVLEARKNPYFNMVELDNEGHAILSKKPKTTILRRQDAPKVYEMNASIFFLSREWLLDETKTHPLQGRAAIYPMEESRSIDVDSEDDFNYVEYLMKKGLEND